MTFPKPGRPRYQPLYNFIIRSRPFSAFAQVIFHGPIYIHLIGSDRHWKNMETSALSPIHTTRCPTSPLTPPHACRLSSAPRVPRPLSRGVQPSRRHGRWAGEAPIHPPPPTAHEPCGPLPPPPHPRRGPGPGRARAPLPLPAGQAGGSRPRPQLPSGASVPLIPAHGGGRRGGGRLAETPTPLCQNLLETRRRSPARSSTHARASPQIDFMVAAVTREEPPAPPPRAPEPVPSRRRSRWSGRDPPPPPYQRQGGGGRATPSNGSAPRQTCSQWRASEGGACSRRRQS